VEEEHVDLKRTKQAGAVGRGNGHGDGVKSSATAGPGSMSEAFRLKVGLAEMLKGGVIMDVMNAEQAVIAQEAGAAAVMALERIPSQIRKHGGVARMSDPTMIKKIQQSVDIPVMAKCRIGHIVEAQILEALEIDFVDESEVLTPADEANHVWKHDFKVPFVCGCRDLGEALRRIGEGAAMIRTKGEAGTGNVVEAVRHMRAVVSHMKRLTTLTADELMAEAKTLGAPFELVREVAATGKLPVPNFAAGGVATPADAALMMKLGAEAVFVGSGIFEVGEPGARDARESQERMAKAIVQAVANWDRPELLAEISSGLPQAMRGISLETLSEGELLAKRGW
jgi:pyridoxal 5'-phosphate synthase pdxS subunit